MVRTSNGTTDERTGSAGLSERGRHELLLADRRRVALAILAERTDPFGIDELAAAVARRETELGGDGDERPSVERIAITLHHNHLPRIADANLVDYDPENRRIDPSGFSLDSLYRS
jgi:hypothetical protein